MPAPLLRQPLPRCNAVMHQEEPALGAQVGGPEEEVLRQGRAGQKAAAVFKRGRKERPGACYRRSHEAGQKAAADTGLELRPMSPVGSVDAARL